MAFVKFQRGSQSAYDKLKANGNLENDALYFIYDKNAPENGGSLYLGEVLIGGSNIREGTNLKDLLDVNINEENPLVDGFILQYNELSNKWAPASLKEAIEAAKPELISILSGNKTDNQTIAQALNALDTKPNLGDIIFLDGVPYIYDGTEWKPLIGSNIENRVASLETNFREFENGIEQRIADAIGRTEHLVYKKVDALPDLSNVTEEEVKNIIFLVPKQDPLEGNKYDEYIFLSNEFEKIGVLGATNLDDYVSRDELNRAVTNLNDSIDEINSNISELSNDVSELQTVISTLATKDEVTNLQDQVTSLQETITDLDTKFVAVGDFNTFKTEVGNLQDLIDSSGKENTTIVEEIIEMQEQLRWSPLEDLPEDDG